MGEFVSIETGSSISDGGQGRDLRQLQRGDETNEKKNKIKLKQINKYKLKRTKMKHKEKTKNI